MADETTYRFILQDEPAGPAASGGAAPVSAGSSPAPASKADGATDIGEQYHAYQQMEAYRRAAEADKEEALAAKQAAREEARAAREQRAAERRQEAEDRRNERTGQAEQERLDNAAASATGKAQNSIIAGIGHLPIFGQTIAVMQQVARPLIDAADALSSIAAAQAGVPSGGDVPTPAVPSSVAAEAEGAAVPVPAAAATAAAGVSAPLLAVGAAAAAGAAALYATVKAANALDDAFTAQARRLSTLNSDLAAAQAQARVQGLLQDIRSARTVGPELADFTASRASIDRSLQRITDVLSKAALEKLNPLLDGIAATLEVISENGPAIEQGFKSGLDAALQQLLGALPLAAIKAGMGAVEDQAKSLRKQKQPGDLFTLFMDIPDLAIDEKVAAGVFQTEPVHFDAVGGAQLP